MKKILFSLFAIMALAFTSCKDEVEKVDPGTPSNPEKELAGTYVGTWSRTLNDETVTEPGTLTIAPTDERYICTVTVSCPAISLEGTDVANITPARNFFNAKAQAVNGDYKIAETFYGKVSEAAVATIDFKKSVKEGRKTYIYTYSFEGQKQ